MKLTHLKAICFSACSCSNISQIFLVYFWMNSCCTCLLAILRWGMMWRRSNFFAMNPRGTWRVAMWWALCRSLLDVFVLVEPNVAATNLHCRFAEVCHCFGHKKLPPTIPNLQSEAQMIWKGPATWKQFQIVCWYTTSAHSSFENHWESNNLL